MSDYAEASSDKPEITVWNRQRQVPVDLKRLRTDAKRAVLLVEELSTRRLLPEDISVVLVSDRRIALLHRDYMQIFGATDVITFEHGDVFISVETARRQAVEFGSSLEKELCLYLIHGLLHLVGFDDHSAEDAAIMNKLQAQLLERLVE
ncbi:MAG: rRNA maturation RNase YbeY [Verrucomicrobia bacterium]|nr:rRNA maturation RNase YbeY [Verrucomicrobiota bacterium]